MEDLQTLTVSPLAGSHAGHDPAPGQILVDSHALALLRSSEARYRTQFEYAHDGLLVLGATTARIENANPRLVEMLGHSRAQLLGRTLQEAGLKADAAQGRQLFERARSESFVHVDVLLFITRSGALIEVEFVSTCFECEGVPVIQCNLRDITERRRMERTLQQLAFHDPLTQLPNRRLLLDRLQHSMHASRRSGSHGALLFIDLDRFKALNDAHGHAAGDQLLVETARRLLRIARASDTVARFGGDEFVILLDQLGKDPGVAARAAAVVTAKVHRALAAAYTLGDCSYRGTCSIGTHLIAGVDEDAEQIIRAADLEMYRSKGAGGQDTKHQPSFPECIRESAVELHPQP